jgi:Cytochrome c554 and c-prime
MRRSHRTLCFAVALSAFGVAIIAGIAYITAPGKPASSVRATTESRRHAATAPKGQDAQPRFRVQQSNQLTLWWDGRPEDLQELHEKTGDSSNIHREDYVGPEACKSCHEKQYAGWSNHPHRRMNSRVEDIPVRGDFADRRISYLDGEITFTKVGESFRIRLERGKIQREYVVDQTVGSRYFQYYVGKQLSGPEPSNHPLYSDSHVIPFGYWIDRNEWVPIVHVHDDAEDSKRHDPYLPRPFPDTDKDPHVYAGKTRDLYRAQCNYCHTTFPLGDMFVRHVELLGKHIPVQLDLSLPEYIRSRRPDLWPASGSSRDLSLDAYNRLLKEFRYSDAREHAATLGISCEACHLGAKEHAQGTLKKPKFFPNAPDLGVRVGRGAQYDTERTHHNVNWICGRCHTGGRPLYAAGMSVWNSTEFDDAARGRCYTKLTCVHCHDPHEAIGHSWSKTPLEDDAICLSCHTSLQPEQERRAHTHHTLEGEGSRCMNCHMPRINEGLQEVVRTHTIFSPTHRAMIESNQMNACNQCHVEQPIDWTLKHLKEWYGATYDRNKIAVSSPDVKAPAAINWLRGTNENVRLVAADALARANATWALPDLLQALDDPFLLNRQFARIGIERMLSIRLSDFSYEFHMTPEERQEPLKKMRENLLPAATTTKAQ